MNPNGKWFEQMVRRWLDDITDEQTLDRIVALIVDRIHALQRQRFLSLDQLCDEYRRCSSGDKLYFGSPRAVAHSRNTRANATRAYVYMQHWQPRAKRLWFSVTPNQKTAEWQYLAEWEIKEAQLSRTEPSVRQRSPARKETANG